MLNIVRGFTLAGIVLCQFAQLAEAEEVRTWTSQDGRTIEAKIKQVENGVATIIKLGRSYDLEVESLSADDQAYLKTWAVEKRKQEAIAHDAKALKISKKGKLLYETNFKNTNGWRVSSGNWKCVDNAVVASQTGKGHKGHMVISNPKPVDVIIECEIQLLEAKVVGFTIDDKPKKLGLINFSAGGFGGQALHRVKSPSIKKRFNSVKTPLKRDEWQRVTIEMLGNQISVSSNGGHASSIDNIWKGKPKRLGLRVDGGPAKYRNIKMWQALPK